MKRLLCLVVFTLCGRGIWQMIDIDNNIVCYFSKNGSYQSPDPISCVKLDQAPKECNNK